MRSDRACGAATITSSVVVGHDDDTLVVLDEQSRVAASGIPRTARAAERAAAGLERHAAAAGIAENAVRDVRAVVRCVEVMVWRIARWRRRRRRV
jgi:hypothetical protein